jgi:hypothetical protein
MGCRWWIFLITILLVLPLVSAEDQIIVNSADWKDVASTMLYGQLTDIEVNYLINEAHSLQLISNRLLDPSATEVLMFVGKDTAVGGYTSQLERGYSGYVVEEESLRRNGNLEIGEKLIENSNVGNFIVMSSGLPYNFIALAPYALLTNSYIIFADSENIDDVKDFLQDYSSSVTLYGELPRIVKEELSELNPEIIGTGDKYLDNIEIIKKFVEVKETGLIVLTHGDDIEPGLILPSFPVLLAGSSNIPDDIFEYLIDSEFTAALINGYGLETLAKKIRDRTGMRVVVKYGRGIASGVEGEVFALEFFPLPIVKPELKINAVRYNALTQKLEVVYENTGDVFAYVQSLSHAISIQGEEDNQLLEVSDDEAFFIDAKEKKTVLYDADLIDYLEEDLSVKSFVIYGESVSSLDLLLEQISLLESVSFSDDSAILIDDLAYNKKTKRFEITVSNLENEPVYVDLEVIDLMVNNKRSNFGSEQAMIKANGQSVFQVRVLMDDVDLADNPQINVKARYGAREDALVKLLSGLFDLKFKSMDYKLVVLVGLVGLTLLLFFITKRRREEEEEHHYHR